MLRLTGAAALALTGCMTAPPPRSEPVTTAASEIRGGTVDDGDPAVATLSVLGLYPACTATLISHHTVLTAGHCDLDALEADFGIDADAPTQSIDIDRIAVHPQFTAEGKPYDLALMKLARDPTGITPVTLNDAPLGPGDVGRMIRHVGYGVTDDATSQGGGTKRTATYPVNQIDHMLVYSGAPGKQSCTGDSGGPGLLTTSAGGAEILVAVVSDGPDCQLDQDGWDDRIDLVKDWIVQTVAAWDDAPPTFGQASAAGSGPGNSGGAGASDPGGAGDPPGDPPGGAGTSGGCVAAPGSGGSLGLALGLVAAITGRRRRRRAGGAR